MSRTEIRTVLVVGAGTIGRYVAGVCRRSGLQVTVFDTNPDALRDAAAQQHETANLVGQPQLTRGELEELFASIRLVDDPAVAGAEADLLIESVPERLKLKRQVHAEFDRYCPSHTIFVTNTSSFLPSMIAEHSGRPDRFAALHFTQCNLIELMPHAGTSTETCEALQAFCRQLGQLLVVCRKEQPGYVLNSLMMPLKGSALSLLADGVASVEDIDRAWIQATQAKLGPFGMLDLVGLDTAWEITEHAALLTRDPQLRRRADLLKRYVEEGRLGVKTGHGFYRYPSPAFRDPAFLKPVFPNADDARQTSPRVDQAMCSATEAVPLIESVTPNSTGDEWQVDVHFDPHADAFLVDHRFRGTPIVPAAAWIEVLLQAGRSATGQRLSQCSQVEFVNGLRFFTEQPQTVRLGLRRQGAQIVCEVRHDFRNRSGQLVEADRLCCRGVLTEGPAAATASFVAPPESAQWFNVNYADDPFLLLGPTMRGLKRLCLTPTGGWGEIQVLPLRAFGNRRGTALISAIDASFVACNLLTQAATGLMQLPQSIDRLEVIRPPRVDEACLVWFECPSRDSRQAEFNVLLFGDDRAPIFSATGYRCHLLPLPKAPAVTLEPEIRVDQTPGSPGNSPR